jgi:hypothetical protein
MYVEHIIYIICTLNIYVYWCNMYIIMSSIYIHTHVYAYSGWLQKPIWRCNMYDYMYENGYTMKTCLFAV